MNTETVDVKSPAAEPSAAQPIQYDGWDQHGIPIVTKKSEATSPADTPKVEKSGAEAKSAAESEAAKKQQESRRKPDAEERISQLTAKNKQLEAELAEARRPKETKKEAETSTAKPAEQPKELKPPVKPKMADFTGADAYEKYEEAKDKYYEELSEYKSELKLQQFREEQANAERKRELDQLLEDGKGRHADYEQVVKPAAQTFMNDKDIAPAVKTAVSNNPLALEIMYVLGGNAEEFTQFLDLARKDPIAAVEKIGVIKTLIKQELGKAKSEPAKAEPARGEDGKFQASKEIPVQNQPRAPKPPAEVGGRNTSTEDPDKAAARSNDTKTAFAEWDRKAFGR